MRLPGLVERKRSRDAEGERTVVDTFRQLGEPVPVGEELLHDDTRVTDGGEAKGATSTTKVPAPRSA